MSICCYVPHEVADMSMFELDNLMNKMTPSDISLKYGEALIFIKNAVLRMYIHDASFDCGHVIATWWNFIKSDVVDFHTPFYWDDVSVSDFVDELYTVETFDDDEEFEIEEEEEE